MPWRERALLAWIAPRGAVAVALAGTYSAEMGAQGCREGELLLPLMLSLSLATITVRGSTLAPVARRLGLLRHR